MKFQDLLRPEVRGTLMSLLDQFYGPGVNTEDELQAILEQPVTESNLSILKSAADIFNEHLDEEI